MYNFRTGDLVAKIHPVNMTPIQIGIIIEHNEREFLVKWTSYDKVFFMEKEEDIFRELNNSLLLGITRVHRHNDVLEISLLNSNYRDGRLYRSRETSQIGGAPNERRPDRR